MYKQIEDYYKKESLYKKIKISTCILAFALALLLSAFSTTKYYFVPMIIIFILSIFIMKYIYEKILNEKLYFNFNNKTKSKFSLDFIVNEKEKIIVIQYLLANNLYNKTSIGCILDHYRCLIKRKIVNSNFLTILSILIPIVLTFITKEGFDTISFQSSFPYILSAILTLIIIYYPISKVITIEKIFTGEDELEERLECIFSELYIEFDKKIRKIK